ncbi:centrosomal protein of 120 kDa-like [Anopheles arabiensis]|uniref:centrosomal protein of 120 kDa-like n=1 Tax=Anopheles arabiensis TaxID=7173 RepID=UPI001AAD5735|nr:centrosomal protein of 120 kDa-like [Anopheles arabiensis]
MEPPHKDDEQQLVIFVQVLGGIHFQEEKQGRKIALTASLNQQVFEAVSRRPVTPGSGTASFDVKLVWQCDRYTLKSIKTKNTPIKLDCYEVQPSGVRSPIGSVVIPLRSVPVVTLSRIKTIKPRWYRLVGIESERWRRIKPELKLLVMVADSQHLDQCQTRDDSSTPDLSGDELLTKRSAPKPETLPRNVELLEDRGLLQVGCKDTETDLFVFEIVLKCVQHLDRLCPGTDTFRLQYELFGERHVSMAERTKSGSPVFDVKAKIRINLRSSILTLVDYFDNGFKIAIMVLTGGEEQIRERTVGTTTIDFVGFLKTNHVKEFKENHPANSYTLEAVRSLPVHTTTTRKDLNQIEEIVPSLKIKLSLRCLGSDRPVAVEKHLEAAKESCIPEQNAHIASTEPITKPDSLPKQLSKPPTPVTDNPHCDAEREKIDIERILLTTEQNLRDIRHTFAFRVCVGTVRFTSGPASGLWQLALQHPKADTPFTKVRLELLPDVAVHEDRIEFGGVTLELFFSTLPDKVVDIIGSEPSKLTLNGPHSTYALARLDNESLLVGTRERQPAGVVVMINEAGENVAIASISCTLEEVGLNYNSQLGVVQEEPTRQDCCHSAAPQTAHGLAKRFDATVAYQLVEKQKAWMHEQRQQFMEQLEEKERKHLQALEQSWKKRQAETEKRLVDRLARADALAAALEEAHRKAETRVPEDGPRVKQIEQQFKAQLEEIRAKAVRLEQEAEAQIETTRRQCRELQQQQAQLSISQQQLLDSNRTLQSELDQERASRAALEQQLEELAESKQHYKELWAKLTRKVHQLQEELSMARTPYFQAAPAKDARKGRRKIVASSSSQMSVARGGPRQGAGDCCNVCDCSDGSD